MLLQHLSILMIEDSYDDAELVKAALKKQVETLTIERVQTAQELSLALKRSHFDIILLDYYLPGLHGLDALKLIRSINRDIPVIIVSGILNEESAFELLNLGANDYVLKNNLSRLVLTIIKETEKYKKQLEIKNLKESISESEEKFKNLFEKIPFPLYQVDAEGKFREVNQAMVELFGYSSREELMQIPVIKLYKNPDNRLSLLKKLIRQGSVRNYKVELVRKNGESFWAELFVDGFFSQNRKLIHQQGAIKDLTEELKNQKLIKENEERLRKILNNMLTGVVVIDPSTARIIDSNPAASQILGINNGNLEGALCYKTLCRKNKPEECELLTLKTDRMTTTDFVPHPHKGLVFLKKSSIRINIGESDRVIASFTDNTIEKELEIELRHAKEKAEQTEQLKSAFLNNISHEVRTPMNGIMGPAQILLDYYNELSEQEKKEYLNLIYKSGERLLSLLDDIMTLSMLQSGAIKIRTQKFALFDVLNELYTYYSGHEKVREKIFQFQCPKLEDSRKITIHSSQENLVKILHYLLDNAFKFTDTGYVSLDYEVHKKNLWIKIKDTGKGIPANEIQAIFEAFTQADNKPSKQHEGAGIGLTIASKLAETMGGHIELDSEAGKGSEFRLILEHVIV